jgi:hypothetical protein
VAEEEEEVGDNDESYSFRDVDLNILTPVSGDGCIISFT